MKVRVIVLQPFRNHGKNLWHTVNIRRCLRNFWERGKPHLQSLQSLPENIQAVLFEHVLFQSFFQLSCDPQQFQLGLLALEIGV